MTELKERYNLFTGTFRVAPRPVVPPHWEVPEDHPSATRFWLEPRSGKTSWRQEGEGWVFKRQLKEWHERQATRVWACRRLVARFGPDDAERRVKDLQMTLKNDIRQANAYLDLLVSIDYDIWRLTRRALLAEKLLVDTTRRVLQVCDALRETAPLVSMAGGEATSRARAAAAAIEGLAETLKQAVSPVHSRFDIGGGGSDGVNGVPGTRPSRKDVAEWVAYTIPRRQYRKPDLRWLLAAAAVTLMDNKPAVSTELACTRVGGYLELLDAPIAAPEPLAAGQAMGNF